MVGCCMRIYHRYIYRSIMYSLCRFARVYLQNSCTEMNHTDEGFLLTSILNDDLQMIDMTVNDGNVYFACIII